MADDPGGNPNPDRITDASWYFMQQLLQLEPGTESSGIYANKPGYHNTRNQNSSNDYSVRSELDKMGPGDKAAAYDWTHWAAQSGDYRSMVKYGERLKAAHKARDPRLNGWREAQGQTDMDSTPEELNFAQDGWTTGTPSSSHAWHWHFSEHRAFVDSYDNKNCMLSILRGESLDWYLSHGGILMKIGEDVDSQDVHDVWENFLAPRGYNMRDHLLNAYDAAAASRDAVATVNTKVDALAEQVGQILEMLGGSITVNAKVDLTDAALDQIDSRVEDAVADAGEGGSEKVRQEGE